VKLNRTPTAIPSHTHLQHGRFGRALEQAPAVLDTNSDAGGVQFCRTTPR